MSTPTSTILLDLRRLQRQSVLASRDSLQALLAAAPAEATAHDSVAYLCGDALWAGSHAAPALLAWLAGRRRRLCLEPLLEDNLLPLVLEEEGGPRRCTPCLEQGAWLWDQPVASSESDEPEAAGPVARGEGQQRERLAWFSPLPPVRSGISDYSAALIPQLANHFQIDVVADAPDTPLPAGASGLISLEEFEGQRQRYPHLLFQVGNSTLHLEHLRQLRRESGTLVLHDFYLSHGLCTTAADDVLGGDAMERMYRSHGYQACWQYHNDQRHAREIAIWRYPCNLEPLQWASGVIVHSREAQRLAETFYGPSAGSHWAEVPLLKRLAPATAPERRRARDELSLADDAFVICSFGFLGVAKLSDRLLQGFLGSALAKEAEVVFVFAGSGASSRSLRLQLELAVAEASRRGGLRAQVRFTGWIDQATYRNYLAAADAAVQLRTSSRGETSAAALDCLGAGLPLIVNDHGSMREFPDQAVLRLPDHSSILDIARALERLRQDGDLRAQLRQAALAYVAEQHDPAQCASRYAAAICAAGAERARQRRWIEAVVPVLAQGLDPVQAANALALLQPPSPRQRQLFLDVSVVARHDLGSGVQRVVRAICEQLLLHPPQGFRVEPVRACEDAVGFRHARNFALKLLGLPDQGWAETPIHPQAGDVFLAIDLDQARVVEHRALLQRLRALGVAVHFVVHDLLPCRQPQYFPPGAGDWHRAWLEVVSQCDGALCVSRSVAADLQQWLREQSPPLDAGSLAIRWFHHGSDFCPPTAVLSEAERRSLGRIPEGTTLLMVGTVEPRKGYLAVIEAATQLWQQGLTFNLVIVGKEGWTDLPQEQRRTIPETVARLRQHPQQGHRLFWFTSASDVMLQALYSRADGLIGASYGEGFGLPLIEAARAGLPLLLRDLPVFREVSQGRASFFPEQGDGPALVAAMEAFLDRIASSPSPRQAAGLPSQTWKQTAAQVVQALGLRWEEAPLDVLPPPPPPADPSQPWLVRFGQRVLGAGRWRFRLLRIRVKRRLGRHHRLRRLSSRLKRRWRGQGFYPSLAGSSGQEGHGQILLETARPWHRELERVRQAGKTSTPG